MSYLPDFIFFVFVFCALVYCRKRAQLRFEHRIEALRGNNTSIARTAAVPADDVEDERRSRRELVKRQLHTKIHRRDRSGKTEEGAVAEESAVVPQSVRTDRSVPTGIDDNCCSICLDSYEAGDRICWAKNVKCNHEYHQNCILPWLMAHDACPLCREDIANYKSQHEAAATLVP